jgi:hypothetical protein
MGDGSGAIFIPMLLSDNKEFSKGPIFGEGVVILANRFSINCCCLLFLKETGRGEVYVNDSVDFAE